MFSTAKVITTLEEVLGSNHGFIALHEPTIAAREKERVNDCLDSGFVSSVGEYVEHFEQQLADYLGVKYVVAVVNGTSALHIALLLAGVEKDTEVIVPTLSFVATANAVTYCDAVAHFVDAEIGSLGMDAEKLENYLDDILIARGSQWFNRHTGRQIAAIVPMHTFGHPVDMNALNIVAEKYNIAVVEDAAESLGSRYHGEMTGSLSLLAAISFNGNKIITTGGGGAIATNNSALAKQAKHLTTTARIAHRWNVSHDSIGFNYRMPNLNAALGCAQLERMDGFLINKHRLAKTYAEVFSAVPGVQFFTQPDYAESNYWLNVLLLDKTVADQRDKCLAAINEAGMMARPAWTLLHTLPMYQDNPRMADLTVAEDIEKRLINIPSSPFLAAGAQS